MEIRPISNIFISTNRINFCGQPDKNLVDGVVDGSEMLIRSCEQMAQGQNPVSAKDKWFLDFFGSDVGEITLTRNMDEAADTVFAICNPQKGTKVLDLCCGKGYMAQALDKRGLDVTGVDLSERYIDFANQNYQTDRCNFVLADAETFRLQQPADLVLNWHTSIGYTEDDVKNMRLMKSISDNLKEGGEFIISTMNPDYVRSNFQRFLVKHIPYEDSSIVTIRESFIDGKMLKSNWLFIYPNGERRTSYGQNKMYTQADYTEMLKRFNLEIKQVFGEGLKPFSNASPTMMIYGKKIKI